MITKGAYNKLMDELKMYKTITKGAYNKLIDELAVYKHAHKQVKEENKILWDDKRECIYIIDNKNKFIKEQHEKIISLEKANEKLKKLLIVKKGKWVSCVVCDELVDQDEYEKFGAEFKDYPAHGDCFDSFDDADEFLKFARRQKKRLTIKPK